jgi:GT2 family glycosyltransferase
MKNNKIGIGIITCNRENFFQKCISNIPPVDSIIVINDGLPYRNTQYPDHVNNIIQHKTNYGVTKSKNEALRYLLDQRCTHIFLHEDDIYIKDDSILEKYIKAAEVSRILHLNYAYHGPGNRDKNGMPAYRTVVTYPDDIKICLTKYTLGAFSYYHSTVLDKVGLMDERFKNALDHVDHTYQIIKAGYHPPFWWFADYHESHKYIDDQDKTHGKSVIRRKLTWRLRLKLNAYKFRIKNGIPLSCIPDPPEEEVLKSIINISCKK